MRGLRGSRKVLPGIYIIKRKIGPSTFIVEDLVDKTVVLRFKQPLNADRLVKFDMPEFELSADQPKRLEMRTMPTQPFNEYRIEKFGIDGRVLLRMEGVMPAGMISRSANTDGWRELSWCVCAFGFCRA